MDPFKISLRPLDKEATKLKELERDLKTEMCSTKAEDDPNDPIKFFASPLI